MYQEWAIITLRFKFLTGGEEPNGKKVKNKEKREVKAREASKLLRLPRMILLQWPMTSLVRYLIEEANQSLTLIEKNDSERIEKRKCLFTILAANGGLKIT